MSLHWPESAYLVNDRFQFIYCPVPKVASSSLKQWFLTTLGYQPDARDWPTRPHLFLTEWLSHRKPAALPDDYFRFGFLRDPRRRLVSAYLQKFVMRWDAPDSPARPVIRAICESIVRPVDYAHGVSFRCFVRYVVACHPMQLDVHWRPQHLFLAVGPRPIDFVGRVESFEADMARLTQRLEIPYRRTFRTLQLPYSDVRVEGASDMTSGQLRRLKFFPAWRSFYDDDLWARVSAYYAEDDRLVAQASVEADAADSETIASC